MNIRYASLLAATKFRTRLGRSILTVAAAAIVASIMLVASFTATGIENAVSQVSETPISQLYLVREDVFSTEQPNPDGSLSTANLPFKNLEEYRLFTKDDNPVDVFQERNLEQAVFIEPALKNLQEQSFFSGDKDLVSVIARSPKLYQAYVDESNPQIVDGTIPAVIGQDILFGLADIRFTSTEKAADRVAKIRTASQNWLGKVVTISQPENADRSAVSQKITIQGFFPVGGLLGSERAGSIIISDAATGNLLSLPEQQNFISYFASFQNQDAQKAYAASALTQSSDANQKFFRSAFIHGNPLLTFQELKKTATNILSYLLLALLVAVAFAMFTTLAKIISDSERESGVFRAIGAKTQDIFQIYLTYSVFVSILAMIVSSIVATMVSLYLNNRYAADLSAQLISLSGSTDTTISLSLLGINPLHLLGVFGAILLASIIGTTIPLLNLVRQDPIKALRAD